MEGLKSLKLEEEIKEYKNKIFVLKGRTKAQDKQLSTLRTVIEDKSKEITEIKQREAAYRIAL